MIALHHQRAGALEHDRTAVLLDDALRGPQPIALHLGIGDPEQSTRFTWMRREDAAFRMTRRLGKQVQSISIDHGRPVRSKRLGHHAARPVVLPEPRTDRNYICALNERLQFLAPHDAATNQLGTLGHDGGDILRTRRDRHQPRTDTQRRLARQTRGACHADSTGDDQHMTLLTFMRSASTPRQQSRESILTDAQRRGRYVTKRFGRQIQRIEHHDADIVRTLAQIEPELEADETQRPLGTNAGAVNPARIGVESAGNVDREDGGLAFVDARDASNQFFVEITRKPRAENGVHDDLGVIETVLRPALCGSAGCLVVLPRTQRIALQGVGRREGNHTDIEMLRTRESRQHVAIAPVISRPAQDDDLLRGRPAAAQHAQCRLASIRHQCVARNSKLVDGISIECTHLSGGVNGKRKTDHVPSILAATFPSAMSHSAHDIPLDALPEQIRQWGYELGFQQIGIASVELADDERFLQRWLELERHGEMDYMSRHGMRRARPSELVPGTIRVISARMDYLPAQAAPAEDVLSEPELGFISRYALGRDYHKVLRRRLARLAEKISQHCRTTPYRAFVDSAPILEKAFARNAGLGWIGKHTNLINRSAGSWFFLGEILTDLPLTVDAPATAHCGTCRACIDICPTQAIVGPYELDARRCISYLTIELRGSIPLEFRKAMGNRIYGCDDCQLVCPWNKFAKIAVEPDFAVRHQLDAPHLIDLFAWTEEEFLTRTEGSAIRRIGYECWLRNIAVALGNAPSSRPVIDALNARRDHASEIVREHVQWALQQHMLLAD